MERLIEDTSAGTVIRCHKDLEKLLQELLDEFAGSGKIACCSVGVERFSRRVQAGETGRDPRGAEGLVSELVVVDDGRTFIPLHKTFRVIGADPLVTSDPARVAQADRQLASATSARPCRTSRRAACSRP